MKKKQITAYKVPSIFNEGYEVVVDHSSLNELIEEIRRLTEKTPYEDVSCLVFYSGDKPGEPLIRDGLEKLAKACELEGWFNWRKGVVIIFLGVLFSLFLLQNFPHLFHYILRFYVDSLKRFYEKRMLGDPLEVIIPEISGSTGAFYAIASLLFPLTPFLVSVLLSVKYFRLYRLETGKAKIARGVRKFILVEDERLGEFVKMGEREFDETRKLLARVSKGKLDTTLIELLTSNLLSLFRKAKVKGFNGLSYYYYNLVLELYRLRRLLKAPKPLFKTLTAGVVKGLKIASYRTVKVG